MTTMIIVLCSVAVEPPGQSPGAWPAVVRVLENDEALLGHHRGYLAYLAKHPGLERAEGAFNELMLATRFRRLVTAFDEALLRDAAAQAAFDRHYDAFAKDDAPSDAPDALAFGDTAAGAAWRALEEHFRAYPHRLAIWRDRHKALAADAQARTWIRWWHCRIRRTPELGVAYLAYLQRVRRQPEEAHATERRWAAQFGPAPEWPPKAAPPALSPVSQDETFPPDRDRLMPERPRVDRPARPAMPRMPDKPERPTLRTP